MRGVQQRASAGKQALRAGLTGSFPVILIWLWAAAFLVGSLLANSKMPSTYRDIGKVLVGIGMPSLSLSVIAQVPESLHHSAQLAAILDIVATQGFLAVMLGLCPAWLLHFASDTVGPVSLNAG
jgi:phosphate:Na+ symporter